MTRPALSGRGLWLAMVMSVLATAQPGVMNVCWGGGRGRGCSSSLCSSQRFLSESNEHAGKHTNPVHAVGAMQTLVSYISHAPDAARVTRRHVMTPAAPPV
jgi:hypothetical protein